MTTATRPYLFYDAVVSICTTCFHKIDGKIVFEEGRVWMLKHCPAHGSERVLMSDDVDYYRQCREIYLKPPEMPLRRNTPIRWSCPYDCGLCPDHEQHSCISLIEVTDACNLRCPICYAESGPERQHHRSLAHIKAMLDAVVENEGEPDVVQISGGEPTIHPDFFAILDAAKERPIKHLMVNTNGVRIARDAAFAERLATYKPLFEIYLQFDSLRPRPLEILRGADLREIRMKALERLNGLDISTTLVVTLQRGVNDEEIGEIIDFALTQPCVRGVTLQPVQVAGRLDGYDDGANRLTLSEVRRKVLEQSKLFAPEDLIPVPCHPDSLCMGYAFKGGGDVVPLTSLVGRDALIDGSRNTIVFERDPAARGAFLKLFSTALGSESQPQKLKDLLCCLPRVQGDISYGNLFRLLIVEFIDAQSFDLRSIKKTCIHIVHPDGRLIPFDTYNLLPRRARDHAPGTAARMGGAMMSEVPSEVPSSAATPPPAPAPARFNVLAMFGGLILSVVLGAIGNVIAGFASADSGAKIFGFLLGIIPGVIFVGLAALLRRKTTAFATGLLIGGCLVGLIGGICGASMVGFSVR